MKKTEVRSTQHLPVHKNGAQRVQAVSHNEKLSCAGSVEDAWSDIAGLTLTTDLCEMEVKWKCAKYVLKSVH